MVRERPPKTPTRGMRGVVQMLRYYYDGLHCLFLCFKCKVCLLFIEKPFLYRVRYKPYIIMNAIFNKE